MMATKDGVAKLRSLGYLGSTPTPTEKDKEKDAPKAEPEEKTKPDPKEKSKSTDKAKSKSGPNRGRPNTNADWTHFNGIAYNSGSRPDHGERARLQRVLDHRSQHDDRRSGQPQGGP